MQIGVGVGQARRGGRWRYFLGATHGPAMICNDGGARFPQSVGRRGVLFDYLNIKKAAPFLKCPPYVGPARCFYEAVHS